MQILISLCHSNILQFKINNHHYSLLQLQYKNFYHLKFLMKKVKHLNVHFYFFLLKVTISIPLFLFSIMTYDL